MAVTSGFFNSENHDRLYDAVQMSSIFDGIILDGVYLNVGSAFKVTAGPEDMQVTVGTGRAWFMHTWTLNDSELVFTVPDSTIVSDRIDAIVIDVDTRRSVRANSIKYVSNVTNKEGGTLINEAEHKQYPICYIDVKMGVTKITDSAITYMCGSSLTPFVTGVLQMLNLDNVTNQFNSEFYEWFEGIKDVLDENTAAKLYNQINTLQTQVDSNTSQIRRIVNEVFDPSNGQNLGTVLTAAQKSAIESGTFADIYPGDYWVINGVKWYVIDYDYYMRFTPHDGTPACTKHHVVVVPEKMFPISKTINSDLAIANKVSHGTDSPFIIETVPYLNQAGNLSGGAFNKKYFFTSKLTTNDGFDFQNPGTDAINFAISAWGADNLVAVPDVFGDPTSMYQDFEWKTVENGILIPHCFDMPSYKISGKKLSYPESLGVSHATLEEQSTGHVKLPTFSTKYSSTQLSGNHKATIYQHGAVLPETGYAPVPYFSINSDCRKYLASRFIPNQGYQVSPEQLPSSFTSLFVSPSDHSLNSSPHGYNLNYTKDSLAYTESYPVVNDMQYFQYNWDMTNFVYVFPDGSISELDQRIVQAGGSALTRSSSFKSLTSNSSQYPGASEAMDEYMRVVDKKGALSIIVALPYDCEYFQKAEGVELNNDPAFRFTYRNSDGEFVNRDVSFGDKTIWTSDPTSIRLETTESLRSGYMSATSTWQYPIVCCVG